MSDWAPVFIPSPHSTLSKYDKGETSHREGHRQWQWENPIDILKTQCRWKGDDRWQRTEEIEIEDMHSSGGRISFWK